MSKYFDMDKPLLVIKAMELEEENKKLKLELAESVRIAKALSLYNQIEAM